MIYWEFDPLSSSVLLSPTAFPARIDASLFHESVAHASVELIKASLILDGGIAGNVQAELGPGLRPETKTNEG